MLISNLYEDAVHLKKTLQDAENIKKNPMIYIKP